MGLALVVGVATKIVVEKENYYEGKCTKEEILEDLKDELKFDLYDIEEDAFVNNICNLLLSETKNYEWKGHEKERFNLILENIKAMDSVDKMKNVVKEEGSYFLHMMSGCCLETISYISKRKFTVYA